MDGRLWLFAQRFQRFDQRGQLPIADVTEKPAEQGLKRLVDVAGELQSFPRNPRDHDPAVLAAALALDKAAIFHAVEQARHIRIGREHSFGRLRAGNSLFAGASQNAQHIVLSRCELELFQQIGQSLLQELESARQVQERLLFPQGERLGLPQFFYQLPAHKPRLTVFNDICQEEILI